LDCYTQHVTPADSPLFDLLNPCFRLPCHPRPSPPTRRARLPAQRVLDAIRGMATIRDKMGHLILNSQALPEKGRAGCGRCSKYWARPPGGEPRFAPKANSLRVYSESMLSWPFFLKKNGTRRKSPLRTIREFALVVVIT
jgi:hypothetical protein